LITKEMTKVHEGWKESQSLKIPKQRKAGKGVGTGERWQHLLRGLSHEFGGEKWQTRKRRMESTAYS